MSATEIKAISPVTQQTINELQLLDDALRMFEPIHAVHQVTPARRAVGDAIRRLLRLDLALGPSANDITR